MSVGILTPRLAAEDPTRLWPARAPGEKAGIGPEGDTQKPTDALVGGKTVQKWGNVSEPTLTWYPAPADKATGAAVLVCPGGGYYILATDLEGTEVCAWLNSIGVTAVLLKYRVPRREGRLPHEAPLEDAQRAMGLIRSQASSRGIDPNRVGCLGFSAGADLCAILCAGDGSRSYTPVDDADKIGCIPNFQVLGYPAYLIRDHTVDVNAEARPGAHTPAAFIVMAADDPIGVDNALGYARALKEAKIPVELHVYATGGHGYGIRRTKEPVTHWTDLAGPWILSVSAR